MSLKKIVLPITVSTTNDNPYKEVIIPLLKHAKMYERGVAYFHCEWVGLAREGLVEFINNGGRMKLLTSIEVDADEFNAFKLGEEAKINSVLKRELIEKIKEDSVKNDTQWMLNYLSWMISEEILDIRITLNKNNIKNIYHDKVSLISDDDSCVCLHGSLNDSKHALKNQESIDVFVSWVDREKKRIEEHRKLFDYGWNGKNEDYIVLKLPDIVKLEFESLKSNYNPYNYLVNKKVVIRDYQEIAVDKIQEANWRGILSMATGSGKTFTSLFAVDRYLELNKKVIVCIVVPQLHLLYQWSKVISEKYNAEDVIICAESKEKWGSSLFRLIRDFSNRKKDKYFIFTTYKTLIDVTFQNAMLRCKDNLIYIFDECHKLGSSETIKKLKLSESSARIGLSATPNRWLDNNGNDFLKKTIGNTVFEFTLEEAIKRKYLAEYEYHINLVELTINENEEFIRLTTQIKRKSYINNEDNETTEGLKRLLNERARLVKKAENKKRAFFKLFEKNEKKFSIVYVFDEQVESMINEIRNKYNLIVYGIIASTPILERNKILKGFNEGEIDVIVAIQCLDEGVDIPNCKSAYLLASSTNPREFIQRRGRVLRLSDKDKKKVGKIYDFVTIAPEINMIDNENKIEVIKRELPRVAEFNRLARNKDSDYCVIDYLTSLNSLYLYAEQDPWNINSGIDKEEESNE